MCVCQKVDFYDSKNPDYGGLNYFRGPSTWGITTKTIPKQELFEGLLEDKDFDVLGLEFDVGETTLRKKFGGYIRPLLEHIPDNIQLPRATIQNLEDLRIKISESSEGSLGIRDVKFALSVLYVAPILYNLIRGGFKSSKIVQHLVDQGITFLRRESDSNTRRAMNRICKDIWNMDFDRCRKEFFIDPLFERLQEQGIDFIVGEGQEHIDPQELLDLLDRRPQEKIVIGGGAQELGLIEHLALAGLGWTEMAKVLEVPDSTTIRGTRRRASESIRQYVKNRWGSEYGIINAFVEFLRTNFLGH